jgi:hypothetical protein
MAVGSIAVISAKSSSTKGRCRTQRRIAAMTGAQFEIRIDGTPRTYRDPKDYAMEAARLIKSKNPHSLSRRPIRPGKPTLLPHLQDTHPYSAQGCYAAVWPSH